MSKSRLWIIGVLFALILGTIGGVGLWVRSSKLFTPKAEAVGETSSVATTPPPKPFVRAPEDVEPTSYESRKNGPFPVKVVQDDGEWIHITFTNRTGGTSHMKWHRDERSGLWWYEDELDVRRMSIEWDSNKSRWQCVDYSDSDRTEFWLKARARNR